jgi:enoyl-CoA hydratase
MEKCDAARSDVLLRDDLDYVSVLTLNRPERLNALNEALLHALMAALDVIELDARIRAVVLVGAGRAFSAGVDIHGFRPQMEAGPRVAVASFVRPGQRLTRRIEAFTKPVIAAVNGPAFGGGCELVEAAHLAIAARSATFCKSEINIGIIPTFGGTQRLPRQVGRKVALELILSGRRFDADEALRLGVVNSVVPEDELMMKARSLAVHLAGKAPMAVSAALAAVHRGLNVSIDEGLAIEEAAFAALVSTKDAMEGIAAFTEKRKARFFGL